MIIGWYKLNPKAIIPTKTDDNAGFDIYTIENNFTLMPHEHHLFSTGLAAVIEPGWWLMAMDRGSTGSKGIHIHCGVIDNGYRGEIFICLNNDNDYPIKFTDKEKPGEHYHEEWIEVPVAIHGQASEMALKMEKKQIIDYIVYPTTKAIAQLIPIEQPKTKTYEITKEDWEFFKNTKRGDGKLGSSGK